MLREITVSRVSTEGTHVHWVLLVEGWANKWFHWQYRVATERRGCGIWCDHKSKIGLIKSCGNLLKQKIRTLDWKQTSGWRITGTMVLTSISSMNLTLYYMSGWHNLHTRRQISKEENQHPRPLNWSRKCKKLTTEHRELLGSGWIVS